MAGIEIKAAEGVAGFNNLRLIIDGKDISKYVYGFQLSGQVNKFPVLTVSLMALDGLDIDIQAESFAEIRHIENEGT